MDPSVLRRLGRRGAAVTRVGLGGVSFGHASTPDQQAEAVATLETAWHHGIRYFDTAPWYGRGLSEHLYGEFLRTRPREEYVLSTKVGRVLRPADSEDFDPSPWGGGLRFDVEFDYSYDGIMRAYEDSLQRLGLPYADILVVHDLDFWYHRTEEVVLAKLDQLAGGGWRALDELRRGGEVKAVGVGINELGMVPRFVDRFDVDFFLLAMRYTLADQSSLEHDLPLCVERGIDIVVGSPFQSGILATGAVPGAMYDYSEASPDQVEHVRRLEAVCRRHGVELAAAALQFPLAHPAVRAVLCGAFDRSQLEANLDHVAGDIPEGLWSELANLGLIRSDPPTPGVRTTLSDRSTTS